MIKLPKMILLIIFMLLFSVSVYAGSESRIGTAGAQELLIPVGARGIAFQGANISDIKGAEAIYWNPAGLAASGSSEAMFSYMSWIADINVVYMAVGAKLGDAGSLGFTFKSLGMDDIPVTTTELPDGTGEMYSPQFLILGATYSRLMTDRINFGATVNLVSESIRQMNATGLAFDFGFQYRNLLPGLDFGIALKNLGPNMQFEGSDVEEFVSIPGTEPGSRDRASRLVLASFDLPTTFEIGLGYNRSFQEQHGMKTYLNFQNFNFGNDMYKAGVEYGFRDFFFLRGGYLLTQNNEDNIFGPTFGLGLQTQMAGSTVGIDYAYRSVDFFDANQFFSVRIGF